MTNVAMPAYTANRSTIRMGAFGWASTFAAKMSSPAKRCRYMCLRC
eukprot:CAMPEP_0181496358 /NCGR_PEP_ID=MMETSP1110-20121109/52928_1 /TAXON_ID=174948 /ORGANISM="Symbiodinium sp., Strain CCMP421" /LENGTH=45 /DNA_ID= /DNA_START= /DNA_END= /DNA_ORIENTATION=